MSASIHSPLKSEVFSSLTSLSPPPTPIAKRARRFFPSDAFTPTPMFFPASQSILGSTHSHPSPSHPPACDEMVVAERKRLALMLASRPTATLRLNPRPSKFGTMEMSEAEDAHHKLMAVQLPPPPLWSPDLTFKPVESIRPPPSLSLSDPSKSSDCCTTNGCSDEPTPMKAEPIAGRPARQARKLPSFQRGGMHRRTVNRCNSCVARSA